MFFVMFKRPRFWLGLLLGGLAAFGTRRLWRLRPTSLDLLLDLVSDAVLTYDASGAVSDANAAGQALFGPDGAGLTRLRYPSGQPVPPGQRPVSRALRTGEAAHGAGYVCLCADGRTRTLDISAKPLPGGGVALTACDRTEIGESRARETQAQRQGDILRALCRRLGSAGNAGELAQALVESARALAVELPEVQAHLYLYDSDAGQLTRLASAPENRPKRPRSHRQSQPPTVPFDASSPLLWSLYVAREPVVGTDAGDTHAAPSYALPLTAGGVALGHLAVTCPAADAFADPVLRDGLGLLASIAALALAGPRQAAQASHLAEQVDALRAVIKAVGERREPDALADLVSREVCRVLGPEVCTLAIGGKDHLRLAGAAYRDALLFPDRHAPDDSALLEKAAREAMAKGKTTQRAGRANPNFEAGVWRAFAGQSGRHSIVSVPLAAGEGALTVYAAGGGPFPEATVKFLETLAGLLSVALVSAARSGASSPAERTGG